jgi:hypothetical protein
MTAAGPGELNASEVIRRIEAGDYPREFVLSVAQGFLPLPQDDLIAVLAFLAETGDLDIGDLARGSLGEMPTRLLSSFAGSEKTDAQHLDRLSRATADPAVLEAIVRNRSTADVTVLELAARADPATQEIIVINQARILRCAEILDRLLENPRLTPETRRRALETREEFFEKRARLAEINAAIAEAERIRLDDPELAPVADLLLKAADDQRPEEPAGEPNAQDLDDVVKMSVYSRIIRMSVSQRVHLAFKGGKTERSILIRDRNRLVCAAVIRNPRISDSEAEEISKMRNVDDEVLRLISMKREWMAKYPILLALMKNPKTPIGVAMPLLSRLGVRDLKNLLGDRGVSETVRKTAKRMFQQKSEKSSS